MRQAGLTGTLLSLADEICDYFGVKIAMYFAWLGFYTSAMVYPAVFGSVLYTFTEADQVPGVDWTGAGTPKTSLLPGLGQPTCQPSSATPRQAGMYPAWSLPSSMWCGQHCSWRSGNGGGRSWPTSGGRWTHLGKPWRSHDPSSGSVGMESESKDFKNGVKKRESTMGRGWGHCRNKGKDEIGLQLQEDVLVGGGLCMP